MNALRYTCLLGLLVLGACRKSPSGNPLNPGGLPVIYVAGDNGTNPVLWEDGQAKVLSSSMGFADQVLVSGNDIYVAGVYNESNNGTLDGPFGQYGYWENGVPHAFGIPAMTLFTSSIALSGNNVFYASSSLWQNNNVLSLPGEGNGSIRAIQTVGTDVYVAGSDSVGDAAYWKDGVLHVVSQGYYPRFTSGGDPSVGCMYVSGTDVYIGGFDMNQVPVYWKNGVPDTLSLGIGSVTTVRGIFVAGTDVYVAGSLLAGQSDIPIYWKNGVETDLPLNGAAYGIANAIFVDGPDVYVAGSTASGAVYWKDGVEFVLSPKGDANSIYLH